MVRTSVKLEEIRRRRRKVQDGLEGLVSELIQLDEEESAICDGGGSAEWSAASSTREQWQSEKTRWQSEKARACDEEPLGGFENEEPPTGSENLECREGARVVVTRRDVYRGRVGVVVSRRGRLYWNVRLDKKNGEAGQVIYKKASGLRVIA